MSSYEELWGLFSRPFVAVAAESFRKLSTFDRKARYRKETTEEQYAIPVLFEDTLDYLYQFHRLASDTPLVIDPKEEHEKLLRAMRDALGHPAGRTEGSANREEEQIRCFLYDEEYPDDVGFSRYEEEEEGDRFEPFYIVRRLDFVLNTCAYGDARCSLSGR